MNQCSTERRGLKRQYWISGGLLLLCLAGSFGDVKPGAARTPRKPLVAPTDGKPAEYTPFPDKLTRDTLYFRLRHDRRVDSRHIRVKVDGARVVLLGSIPNYFQQRVTHEIAQSFVGVTVVDDRMKVLSIPPPPAQLKEQVRQKLSNDWGTKNETIDIKAQRDVVTLTATVSSLYAKQKAIHLAASTPRVSVVQDHITIRPAGAGEEVAERVRQALAKPPLDVQRPLTIVNTGTNITVRGGSYTPQAKSQIETIASMVPGVTRLNNAVSLLPRAVRQQWRARK